MLKSLLAAVFVALSSTVALSAPADLNKFTTQALTPTVQLNGNCSGTIVSSHRDEDSGKVSTVILTAEHCVSKVKDRISEVSVPNYDKSNRLVSKSTYKAKVLGTWYKGDLAILELQDKDTLFKNVATIAPADTTIPMGSDVYTVGYPAGMALSFTEGVFGARESFNFPTSSKDTEYFRATPPIMGGNSGGGLYRYNGAGYDLIGVSDLVLGGNPHMGWYVPVDQIHDYLKVAAPKAVEIKK